MSKFSIEYKDFEKLLDQISALEGDVKEVTEKALKASHEYITPLIEEKVQDSNLPAKGKYASDGKHVRKQIIKDQNITWDGTSCSIDIGFSLKESIVPIFMIRGTESMNPVKGLKNTLEGKGTKDKVAEIQENVISEEIMKLYGK